MRNLNAFLIGILAVASVGLPTETCAGGVRAVASGVCGSRSNGPRYYFRYLEPEEYLLAQGARTAACQAAFQIGCGLVRSAAEIVLNALGEPEIGREVNQVVMEQTLECRFFPSDRTWNPETIGDPLDERAWDALRFVSPRPAPQVVDPGLIPQWKEHLEFLSMLISKYKDQIELATFLALGVILTAAVAFFAQSAGFSSLAAVFAIVLLLGSYYDLFTPEEKKRFDEIRNLTASVDIGTIDVKIDKARRTLTIDRMEFAFARQGGSTRVEVKKLDTQGGVLDFMDGVEFSINDRGEWMTESDRACIQGHTERGVGLVDDGGCS